MFAEKLKAFLDKTTNQFLRDAAKLSLGTLGGRLITIAAMPLLTRIYSPTDFGVLASFLAIVTIVGVIACLRFDIAIPLSHSDKEAAHLLLLSMCLAATFFVFLLVPAIFLPASVAEIIGIRKITGFLWLVPFGVFLVASYSAMQRWHSRARRFGVIARTRVFQATIGVLVMVIGGFLNLAPFSLLLGNALNIGAGGLSLAETTRKRDWSVFQTASWVGIKRAFIGNIKYPIYSVPEALANTAGIQLPILIIAAQSGPEAGFIILAMQIMFMPMKMFGQSLSQVFASRGPEKQREGELASFTITVMKNTARAVIIPVFLIAVLAPSLVPLILGSDWVRVSEIMIWMAPWAFIQLVASPVSMVVFMVGWHRVLVLFRVVTFSLRIGMTVAAVLWLPVNWLAPTYALTNLVCYSLMAILFIFAAKSAGKIA